MTSQSAVFQTRSILEPKIKKQSRLLIISDEPQHVKYLQSEFGVAGVEITNVSSAEEVRNLCRGGHDLAVIDVAPGKVLGILETLRASDSYRDISVLVDNSRLQAEPSLAGVLPSYRAMPCNYAEIVRLTRRRVSSALKQTGADTVKRML